MSKMRKIVLVLRIFFSTNDRIGCGVKILLYNEKCNLRDLSGIAWNMNRSELIYFIENKRLRGKYVQR